jgi:3-methyladenine DNA glycosylase/8-oxoguanine DNA glycosylase
MAQGPAAVRTSAWGPGAEWALRQLPALLGAYDDPSAFTAHHDLTRESHRRNPGLRLPRTGLVMEALIPSVLEQKVTTHEAYRAWRLLVRRFGERAPGPHESLYVMPSPRDWCRIPSWEWHRAGVDGKRSGTVVRAAQRAARMEQAAAMELDAALRRLQAIPGIGPWTAAETLQRSNGAPDAITVGDLHLPRIIGYALTGLRDVDDDGMLELLAPYTGQRHRAARLILLTGLAPARRQPRFPVGDIARL